MAGLCERAENLGGQAILELWNFLLIFFLSFFPVYLFRLLYASCFTMVGGWAA